VESRSPSRPRPMSISGPLPAPLTGTSVPCCKPSERSALRGDPNDPASVVTTDQSIGPEVLYWPKTPQGSRMTLGRRRCATDPDAATVTAKRFAE